jgi:hypothetical protein
MVLWQQLLVATYGCLALISFIVSFRACYYYKKAYAETPLSGILFGGFVQADNVIFGMFWFLTSTGTLLLKDWLLFLLIVSSFWLVRSIGETLYWFLQQFTFHEGNPPQKFWHHRIFHNDSVWFVNQIYWQCISVVTIITTIYLANLWLKNVG